MLRSYRGLALLVTVALCALAPAVASASSIRVAETFLDLAAIKQVADDHPGRADMLSSSVDSMLDGAAADILISPPDGKVLRARNVLFDGNPPDLALVSRSSVGTNFGIETTSPVTVNHDLSSWVMPPPDISTFDDVVLTILAVDRDGGRELIFTDEGLVGALWPGSGFTVNFDTLGNVRGSLRNDGMVELTIEPIARPGKQNAIQILGTRVAANVHPIPEPHAAATYAIGLLIAGAAVRRRR